MSATYRRHALSAAFPDMPEADFAELVDDIAAHGLRHPVMLYQGQVLDGWHRYQAFQEAIKRGARVSISINTYSGNDPVGYVISENLMRRNLTASQRALAVVAVNEWKHPGRPEKNPAPGAGLPEKTGAELAHDAGVSERTIRQAKAVQTHGAAALKEAVKDGDVSLKAAEKIAPLPKAEQRAAMCAPAEPRPVPKPHGASDAGITASGAEALRAEIATLKEELAEARENAALLAIEAEAYQAFKADAVTQELVKVKGDLLMVERRRDELLAERDQQEDTRKRLERELKKHGWKGWGK